METLGLRSDDELLRGLAHPVRGGIKLWLRSIGPLAGYVAPIAAALAVPFALEGIPLSEATDENSNAQLSAVGLLVQVVGVSYGMAVTATLLSHRYLGTAENAYKAAARRFLPWFATWVILAAGILLGTLALIVPGIIIGIRLFWADEFALIHRAGPIRALRESWALTENAAGSVFGFQFLMALIEYALIIPLVLVWVLGLTAIGSLGSALEAHWLSLLTISFSYLILFVGYASFHSPELVYFYGARAARVALSAGSPPQNWLSRAAALQGQRRRR